MDDVIIHMNPQNLIVRVLASVFLGRSVVPGCACLVSLKCSGNGGFFLFLFFFSFFFLSMAVIMRDAVPLVVDVSVSLHFTTASSYPSDDG